MKRQWHSSDRGKTMVSLKEIFAVEPYGNQSTQWWNIDISPKALVSTPALERELKQGTYSGSARPRCFLISGRNAGDMIETVGNYYVVSDRFSQAIASRANCDLNIQSVDIFDKNDDALLSSEHKLLQVAKAAGPSDSRKGHHLLLDAEYRKSDPSLAEAFGLFFDLSTWNGHNVFRLDEYASPLLVTKDIANYLVECGMDGLRITSCSEYNKWVRDGLAARIAARRSRT